MTQIQEQAIALIRQLPDSKIQAIITLAADELQLTQLQGSSHAKKAGIRRIRRTASELS